MRLFKITNWVITFIAGAAITAILAAYLWARSQGDGMMQNTFEVALYYVCNYSVYFMMAIWGTYWLIKLHLSSRRKGLR